MDSIKNYNFEWISHSLFSFKGIILRAYITNGTQTMHNAHTQYNIAHTLSQNMSTWNDCKFHNLICKVDFLRNLSNA